LQFNAATEGIQYHEMKTLTQKPVGGQLTVIKAISSSLSRPFQGSPSRGPALTFIVGIAIKVFFVASLIPDMATKRKMVTFN
jgi:hypothetical protein